MAKQRTKHYSVADLNSQLPEEVSKLYKVVKLGKRSSTRFMSPDFGIIDLKTISLKKVEQLIKSKCPYFESKGK